MSEREKEGGREGRRMGDREWRRREEKRIFLFISLSWLGSNAINIKLGRNNKRMHRIMLKSLLYLLCLTSSFLGLYFELLGEKIRHPKWIDMWICTSEGDSVYESGLCHYLDGCF